MARPILETLNHLNNGTLMMDASEAMAELVQAVGETGKAGKITIEISIRKATAGAMAQRLSSMIINMTNGGLPRLLHVGMKQLSTASSQSLNLMYLGYAKSQG